MAINFPDNPSNGDTHQGYTYNNTKGTWTPASSPAAVVEYATADLLPGTADAGDMAFVTATNRLYLWNGSGWYNIALINTNPTMSGVSSSYALASDGTATTVTITATDPEGVPITYSIASDTSGNIATVSQGTGSNSNVFTITPSTNTAHAGTFSLTFRASDGVNIASTVSSFTLAFRVTNSNYTTSLITTSGSAGTNSTFTDSSTSSHTFTVTGNVHQTSFSPYRHGGYSAYFDGTGDYLRVPNSANFDFPSDFTLEFSINFDNTSWPSYLDITGNANNGAYIGSGRGGWIVSYYDSSSTIKFSYQYNSSWVFEHSFVLSAGLEPDQWYHMAFTRESNSLKCFLNGQQVGSTITESTSIVSGEPLDIGTGYNGTGTKVTGYITDYRIVQGTAVYTAAFTPPTERLTAITNTSLLACHLPYFADGSTNNHTITPNGNAATKPFVPYDYKEYAVGNHGGSAYFDSNTSYLTTPDSDDWYLNADFTIEFWFYKENTGTFQMPFSQRQASTSELRLVLDWSSGDVFTPGNLMLEWHQVQILVSGAGVRNETWNHIVIQRSGTSLYMYLNGYMIHGAQQPSTLSNYSAPLYIGNYTTNSSYDIKGNLTDFRWVKGTAVYSTSGTVGDKLFTPPTEPLTAITNTKLLLNTQGAKILDKSQSATNLTLVGNTTSSTAQYKYLPTSIYFDGAGDVLYTESNVLNNFGTADFTLEAWIYPTAYTSSAWNTLFSIGNSTNNGGLLIGKNASEEFVIRQYGVADRVSYSTLPSLNTWTHLACVRSNGTSTIYYNGVAVASASDTTNYSSTTPFAHVGNSDHTTYSHYWSGYVEDLRFTPHFARYTANFTPPTAALEG